MAVHKQTVVRDYLHGEKVIQGFLIELKYMNRSEQESEKLDHLIRKNVEEGKSQLNRYAMDERIQKRLHGTELVKVVLVFRGWELVERKRV